MTINTTGNNLEMKDLRIQMVEAQIKSRGVSNPRVLETMIKVPREKFVPEELQRFAFDDGPLPIGEGQTISQPYIVAYMTELLGLKGHEKVLEIGTGSGYQTAILAELAKEVYTIERIESLSKKAQSTLKDLEFSNIYFLIADGKFGWKDKSPFDAILVTAAAEEIPKPLIDQLKINGTLVIPVGSFSQEIMVVKKTNQGTTVKRDIAVRFVPLREEVQSNETSYSNKNR